MDSLFFKVGGKFVPCFHVTLFLAAALLAQRSAAQTLFAHYRFDNSGNLLIDSSGQGHNADYIFFAGAGGQFPQYTAAGVAGGAVQLNGTNGLAWQTSTNLQGVLTTNFSVSLWLKTTQVYGADANPGFTGAGILVGAASTTPMSLTGSKLAFYTGSPGNDLHSTSNINSGQFTHLVVTRNAATGVKQIYVNGALNASVTAATGYLPTPSEVRLGYNFSSGAGISGVIDDMQVYEGVLSAGQVTSMFNNPGTAAPAIGSLSEAVDAPQFTWTTGGNTNWVSQTTNTFDGVDAAQSGACGNNQSNFLQTVIQGPGTLTFRWKVSSQTNSDYLRLVVNGVTQTQISGTAGWVSVTNQLASGSNNVRWLYIKDASSAAGEDRGWVDTVSFALQISVDLELNMTWANNSFYPGFPNVFILFPQFLSISPLPNTTGDVHRAESPNGQFVAQKGGDNISRSFSTFKYSLGSMIDEVTNGLWHLYLNKGTVGEKIYTFRVSMNGLDTNVLRLTTILAPTNGSVNVSTNPAMTWSMPQYGSSVSVNMQRVIASGITGPFTNATLPVGTTSWTALSRPYGTNRFQTSSTTGNISQVSFTAPTNATGQTLNSWTGRGRLTSQASVDFVIGAATPEAVPDMRLEGSNGNALVSFSTQPGRTHTLQLKTNLIVTNWLNVTSFVGDGALRNFSLIISNQPEGYYRVITQ